MIKFFMIFTMLFSSFAFADDKEKVNVYNKYRMGGPPGVTLKILLDTMNHYDSKHTYVYSQITGAKGEAAISRGFIAKEKSLIYGASSDFTFNRITKTKTKYDKSKDFTIIYGTSGVYWSLMIDKKSNISTVKDLIDNIKTGDIKFYADYTSSAASKFLTEKFLKNNNIFGLMKPVLYTKMSDINRSIASGETNIIFLPAASVKVGKSLLKTDMMSISIFFSSKRHEKFAMSIIPILEKVCSDSIYKAVLKRFGREDRCYNTKYVNEYINNEWKSIQP